MMFGNILPIFNCGNFPLPNVFNRLKTGRKAVADAGHAGGNGKRHHSFSGGNGNFETFFCFVPKKLESYFPNVDILYTPEDKHVHIIPWSFGSDHFPF